jgi:dTDP-4-amino-4,6-dideoxygalactose transaminase
MDPESLEKAITPRTRAIVPVHLYGQSAPMQEILDIAEKHGLYVIEDNAQAIGASYTMRDSSVRKTGTMGTIGTTSFFPSKNLGCYGDGGAIFTQDDALADKMRMIANHGQSKRYYHDVVGCNSRLDTVQAAILNIKLGMLDQYNAARQAVAAGYNAAFAGMAGITTPYVAPGNTHVYHQYTLILEGIDRDALHEYLATVQVPSMIYYPVPAHRQKMFDRFQSASVQLPSTDWLTERVISLPVHTEMDSDQLTHITNAVKNFVDRKK